MAVTYTPEFRHKDWVDNVDRVRAAGDNGFNVRFHALEAEFARIADIMDKVSDALDALSQTPVPKPVKLTLTPTLITLTDPWNHVFGGADKPSGATDASGMMSVTLPHGATIRELRACGRKDSGNLSVNLRRQSLAAGSTTELLVGLTLSNGNFDSSAVAPAGAASKVDNDQFRYYLTAELDGAGSTAVVSLTCFQITCVPS
ncbi:MULTISPECIES: hypothetical protein [Nonomuraea]|uniref:Uncharacterized protein n=1 Tax=Nonomuraea ferruginea TaxID=46174 RepID=A0ABT4SZW3_9ACTN|nr:hypothetical protein [Nonomuraea ferruginea]MDA0642812.1 hypothetical protein [Nonomuraea ferruginea]